MSAQDSAALFGPALARYLEEGCRLSYVRDDVTGGVFADLRRPDGLLIEDGLGVTAGEALEHLKTRLDGAL